MDVMVELHVEDLDASIAFYALLGFHPARRAHDHAILVRDSARIALHQGVRGLQGHEHFSRHGPGTARGYGVEIVVMVDDLDAAHGRLRAHAVMPIQMRKWGVRDFRAQDPSGFYVCVSERYDVTRDPAPRE